MKSTGTEILVLVLAILLSSSTGTGSSNTLLPEYCHWYWQ